MGRGIVYGTMGERWGFGRGVGLLLSLGLAGCEVGDAFSCQTDAQCGAGGAGTCQPSGYCSFMDDGCESGQRYAELSGPLSLACVPLEGASSEGSAGASTSVGEPSIPVDASGPDADPPLTGGPVSSTGPGSGGETTEGPGEGSGDGVGESSGGGVPLDPDLVLWLEFEDPPEAGVFDSASMLEGSCDSVSCPQLGPGRTGSAAIFDGIDDVIEISHGPYFETPTGFTLSLWLWLDEEPTEHRSLLNKPLGSSFHNSWELLFFPIDGSAALLFNMHVEGTGYGVTLPGPPPLAQWVHVAGVWDGSMATLWVDGRVVGSEPAPELQLDDHPVLVGADLEQELPEAFFPGRIDDVRIYRRAFDGEEIAALHQGR